MPNPEEERVSRRDAESRRGWTILSATRRLSREALFYGSSRIWLQRTLEGAFDLQDEVGVVAEAVRLALDDLDLVVDAFEPAGVDRIAAVIDDPLLMPAQVLREGSQCNDPTLLGQGTPLVERFPGPGWMLVVPNPLELVLQDVDGAQGLVRRKELSQRLAL